MKRLVVNADDFGYRTGINRGIMDAHTGGVVTSTSLLVERDGTADAVDLARRTPTIGIGIHLDLDRFFRIDRSKEIVEGWVHPRPDMVDVWDEIERQIDLFFSFGLTPDHLDSHHHTHLHPGVFPLACKAAGKHKIPFIRLRQRYGQGMPGDSLPVGDLQWKGLKTAGHFIEGWYWGNIDEPFETAELMTHPGYGESWREEELRHCCDPQLNEYLRKHPFELVRFSDLA